MDDLAPTSTQITAPLLEVSGLTKRFGGLVAVRDIGFRIRPGEILGLIGPNGSGKSTVMRLVMGIERPNAGSIRLGGTEIAGWPTHRIARSGIGIVFQHSRPLHRQTVLENIKLALLPDSLWRLVAEPHVERRAREIAERVGLGEVLGRRPSTLPFADLRRLEMAKALARDPRVVLIDEPFAGLTQGEVATFSELIDGFRRDGHAVLLVDHNVKSVAALVDRVLAMYLGERIAEGTADEVMRDETVRRVYLGGKIETHPRQTTGCQWRRGRCWTCATSTCCTARRRRCDRSRSTCNAGEFVSVVGLNGAGKTTLFNAISGLVPFTGDIRVDGGSLRGRTPAWIARGGVVQCPETRELFGDLSVRENLDLGGQHLASDADRADAARLVVRAVSDPERAPEPERPHTVGRRAADAGDRAGVDDAAEAVDPGRADAGPGAGDPGAIVQGAQPAARDDADHGLAGRAKCHLRVAARRPGVCAGTCPYRLGGRSGEIRRGNGHRLPVITTPRTARSSAQTVGRTPGLGALPLTLPPERDNRRMPSRRRVIERRSRPRATSAMVTSAIHSRDRARHRGPGSGWPPTRRCRDHRLAK